jgi:exosortase
MMTAWVVGVFQQTRIVGHQLVHGPWLSRPQKLLLLVLATSLLWAYWPTLADVAERWAQDPQYSHGYVVPAFAVFLLWWRRGLCPGQFRGSPWGLLVLAAAQALHLVGICFHLKWLEGAALVPSLLGVGLLLGGRAALRWSWPAACFLLFMFPLPFRVEVALAHPLQRLATRASTVCLVLLGVPATASGNVITLSEARIGVAEACSGLSMLLTFFALAVGCAAVVRRPLLDRVLLVVAAIPIALCANVARITITGALYEWVGETAARAFFHDLAGWFMMPFALGLVWALLLILSRLFVAAPVASPVAVVPPTARTAAVGPAPRPARV